MHEHTREEVISEIISEFSQSFAAARTRWTRFAEEVHPELRGPGMMILQTILRRGPVTLYDGLALHDVAGGPYSTRASACFEGGALEWR